MANPVRDDRVLPFPADRVMVAHGRRAEYVVIHAGATEIFANRVALRDALFPEVPEPTPIAVGDQVAVVHNGITRTFHTYDAFVDRIAFEARARRAIDRKATFVNSPWRARLQFLVAERAGILTGLITAAAIFALEHLK